MKAGLFDRAEEAYRALEGTAFDTEARLALLALHERSRDWRAADRGGAQARAQRHRLVRHRASRTTGASSRWRPMRAQQPDEADEALQRAREAAPQARAPAGAGRPARWRGAATTREALQHWGDAAGARSRRPSTWSPRDYADSAHGLRRQARRALEQLRRALPARADDRPAGRDRAARPRRRRASAARCSRTCATSPTLSAAQALLRARRSADAARRRRRRRRCATPSARAAKPLQRYRCAACGFEAQHYFWQCPGCLGWDSYPPQRLEDL